MPKMINFGEFLNSWRFRSNSVTRQVSFNRTNLVENAKNSNATFWVIFKQCVSQQARNRLKVIFRSLEMFASEASYIYILIGQKWIKKAKNGPFWRVFENLKLAVKQCYRQVNFNRTKIGEKCQTSKIEMRHFE